MEELEYEYVPGQKSQQLKPRDTIIIAGLRV